MNTKHTPGPWQVCNEHMVFSALGADSGDGARADDNDGWCICICQGDEVPMTSWGGTNVPLGWGPTRANARLIASAPELLAACAGLLDALRTSGVSNGAIRFAEDQARAAIAKAEGRA